MSQHDRSWHTIVCLSASTLLLAIMLAGTLPAQTEAPQATKVDGLTVPKPIRIEHEHLHKALKKATEAGGETNGT